jgi:uncharacterized protein YjbJ (UPF0337 family)
MSLTDKAKNKIQTTKGEAKEFAGRVRGDRDQEAEGKVDQFAGNIKQAGEKLKDAVKK